MLPKWWKIYYDSGATFTESDGTPYDAPRQGLQCVVQEKDGDYEIIHGRDHFYWEPKIGGWYSSDLFGAMDHLLRSERQCLLFGRVMEDEAYRLLMKRVREEVGERVHCYARERNRQEGR